MKALAGFIFCGQLSSCLVPQPEDETGSESEASSDETSETSETGAPVGCGWDLDAAWYACGFEGEDPSGVAPRACTATYMAGDPCPNALLLGCCDGEDRLWYCADDEDAGVVVRVESCG